MFHKKVHIGPLGPLAAGAAAAPYLGFLLKEVPGVNIVTGLFVEGTIEMAKRDRMMMVKMQNNNKEALLKHLVSLLAKMDQDGDSSINRDEFFAALVQKDVQEFLDALGIDPENAAEVFMLLDEDGDGTVHLQEFMSGMERIRGEAKSIDIHMVRMYLRKITDEIAAMRGMRSGLLHTTTFGRVPDIRHGSLGTLEAPLMA